MGHVISEFSILRMCKHPFIVNLKGHTQDERYLYIALEYVAGGELFTYLSFGTVIFKFLKFLIKFKISLLKLVRVY